MVEQAPQQIPRRPHELVQVGKYVRVERLELRPGGAGSGVLAYGRTVRCTGRAIFRAYLHDVAPQRGHLAAEVDVGIERLRRAEHVVQPVDVHGHREQQPHCSNWRQQTFSPQNFAGAMKDQGSAVLLRRTGARRASTVPPTRAAPADHPYSIPGIKALV